MMQIHKRKTQGINHKEKLLTWIFLCLKFDYNLHYFLRVHFL